MHLIRHLIARSAKALGVVGLFALLCPLRATPPPSSFGVWDRGNAYDPKDYPFLKGLAFNQDWAGIEPVPGVFDWSALDRAMESAVAKNQYIYLSIGVGPDAPAWIYQQGVPAVKTDGQMHDAWPVYPYYPSPAYRKFFERLITELGKHIRTFPKDKQKRIAFILFVLKRIAITAKSLQR